MKRLMIFIFLVFVAVPAHAEIAETAESYYGRLMKSCEYTARESWRDYLLYAPNKRVDECCASSVRDMARLGAKEAQNRQCPPGYQVNQLKCTSSKVWCEETKPGK